MTQQGLFTSRAPRVSDSDVATLIRHLHGHGWQTAKQLSQYGWTDRKLRAVANASKGRVISGQHGYALIESATVDEANHAAAWLERQAAEMQRRARDIRKAMHKRTEAA